GRRTGYRPAYVGAILTRQEHLAARTACDWKRHLAVESGVALSEHLWERIVEARRVVRHPDRGRRGSDRILRELRMARPPDFAHGAQDDEGERHASPRGPGTCALKENREARRHPHTVPAEAWSGAVVDVLRGRDQDQERSGSDGHRRQHE